MTLWSWFGEENRTPKDTAETEFGFFQCFSVFDLAVRPLFRYALRGAVRAAPMFPKRVVLTLFVS